MIKKPSELNFSEKKLFGIVAGVPGIGKTTLALSSPKPLLIDLDKGIGRVEPKYRCDIDDVNSYEELRYDLEHADLSEYKTIVIDTGGKLLEMLKPVVIKENAKNGQTDGSLSLKGYGAVKRKFADFVQFVKGLGKHLIVVFHATEVQLADDITGLRIRIEGGTKDEIWDDADFGGFIEMQGTKRVIGFSNCARYYAKGTQGISGKYEIPDLNKTGSNTFFAVLFKKVINELNSQTVDFNKYKELVDEIKPIIASSDTVEAINECYTKIASSEHHLTSKEELWAELNAKAKELGFTYDKSTNSFK